MWRVLVHDIECRRLRSCIDESCAVCYAMTMRNEKKSNTHVSGRLRAVSARSCWDIPPIYLPSLNRTAHPRRASTDETSIVIDYNCLGTCDDD